MESRAVDFNKEILIGELGALLGASFFGLESFLIGKSPNFISIFTIIGSIIGGSYSWLITRIYDERKRNEFSIKKLKRDLSLYTPIALLVALLITYPIVFFVTRSISSKIHLSFLGPFAGELSGFAVFIVLMNGYRYILKNSFHKIL